MSDLLALLLFEVPWIFALVKLNKEIKYDQDQLKLLDPRKNFNPSTVLTELENERQAGSLSQHRSRGGIITSPHEYVAKRGVEGIVTCGNPFESKTMPGTQLVLAKSHRDSLKMTLFRKEYIKSKAKNAFISAVPFQLQESDNPKGAKCHVKCTLEGDISRHMEKIGEKRAYKFMNFREHIISWLFYFRIGWVEHEFGIAVGTPLFAFGDVIYNTAQKTLRIENPLYLVKDKMMIIRDFQYSLLKKHVLKVFVGFTMACAAGVFVVLAAKKLWKRWEMMKIRKLTRMRSTAAKNQNDCEELLCVICAQTQRNIIILPCNHLCVCYACYQKLNNPKVCPFCKTPVTKTIEIFQKA
jgi:hypothetical protein